MNTTKNCIFCGEPFVPLSNHQRYCKRLHYMNCPVCGKQYLVTNNESLKRPPVACSYVCRVKRTKETSLERYGVAAPGNNPEARLKAKATMQEKFGVDYTLQSDRLKQKVKKSIQKKYNVKKNIQQDKEVTARAHLNRTLNWIEKVHKLLPMKLIETEELPNFQINDDEMEVYVLTEKASIAFLSNYGFRIAPKFAKVHLSVGLVKDGILYQVLRFEKIKDRIELADFGIRKGYFNPNYYSKLLKFMVDVKGIEEFTSSIPRNIATKEVIDSLQLQKVSEGDYKVYWKIDDKFVKLTQRHNIEECMSKYEYVTTDCVDEYIYSKRN